MTNHTNSQHADETGDPRRLRLHLGEEAHAGARIKVIGVGGGGSNAVNRMVAHRARRRRVHRREHRPPGAAGQRGAHQGADWVEADQGARRRRRPERGPFGGARGHRPAHSSARRRRHDLRDDRPGRRDGHGRGAGHREPGERARRPDGGRRHQAVPLRRPQAPGAGRARARAAARLRGHDHHDPERAPADDHRPVDAPHRRVLDGRRRAPAGNPGHLRPDSRARAHQPRLRGRQDDHVRDGVRDDGHRRRGGRRTARSRRRAARSPVRCSRARRSTAPAA